MRRSACGVGREYMQDQRRGQKVREDSDKHGLLLESFLRRWRVLSTVGCRRGVSPQTTAIDERHPAQNPFVRAAAFLRKRAGVYFCFSDPEKLSHVQRLFQRRRTWPSPKFNGGRAWKTGGGGGHDPRLRGWGFTL